MPALDDSQACRNNATAQGLKRAGSQVCDASNLSVMEDGGTQLLEDPEIHPSAERNERSYASGPREVERANNKRCVDVGFCRSVVLLDVLRVGQLLNSLVRRVSDHKVVGSFPRHAHKPHARRELLPVQPEPKV